MQTPAASRPHTAVTSRPDTGKNNTRLFLPPVLWWNLENIKRLKWCIINKQEVTDFVMNSPSCILHHYLEALRSLHCKTVYWCPAYWCPSRSEQGLTGSKASSSGFNETIQYITDITGACKKHFAHNIVLKRIGYKRHKQLVRQAPGKDKNQGWLCLH